MKYSVETLPRMDADIKKKAGLYTNNTFKGNNNFEKVPTFNGIELLTNEDLNGTNYIMVYGVGTPTQNAAELQDAYDAAKNMPRYLGVFGSAEPFTGYVGQTFQDSDVSEYHLITRNIVDELYILENGDNPNCEIITEAEAKSVRTTVVVAPGEYEIEDNLELNASGINLVSLTGTPDVVIKINAIGDKDIYISKSFVTLQGIKTVRPIRVAKDLESVLLKKCVGGDSSFSCRYGDIGTLIQFTSIDCEGGEISWSVEWHEFRIRAENCIGSFDSFGSSYSSMVNNFIQCVIMNCGAKGGSFDAHGGAQQTEYIGCYIIEDPQNAAREGFYAQGNFAGGGGQAAASSGSDAPKYISCRLSPTGVVTKWATSIGGNPNGVTPGTIAFCVDGNGQAAPNT